MDPVHWMAVVHVTDSARLCDNCLTPVGPRDRVCFMCHRPLRSAAVTEPSRASASVGTAAVPEVHPDANASTSAVTPSPATAVDGTPPAPDARSQPAATAVGTSSLSVQIQWGRTRTDVEIPATGSSIGSAPPSDIIIGATYLDAVHARVFVDNGQWFIESRTSVGLVLQRGVAVTRSAIAAGDTIRLSDRVGNFASLRVRGEQRGAARKSELRGALPGVGQSITIGSSASCTICLEHPLVQPRHAVLRRDRDGNLILEDRTSVAGTYVDGQRLRGHRRVGVGTVIQIGPFSARVSTDSLDSLDQVPGIDLVVSGASVTVDAGRSKQRQLLTDVSLHLPPASLTAVAGPSGAGKTTLMRLLAGQAAASHGVVTYNGVDLAACRHAYAGLMGFVPQDDVVHPDLTVAEALGYQARLRLGRDRTPAERRERIERALEFVGLVDQKCQLVKTLSGGQRKRVSIACELLIEPEILFLDEPTSGLDPGLDKRMMLLLRLLADQGRTVILTTHAIAHVSVCETLVLVGPGGRVIYAGEPDAAPEWFGVPELGDAFSLIETPDASAQAAERLTASLPAARPTPDVSPQPLAARPPDSSTTTTARPKFMSPPWREVVKYFGRVYVERYVRLLGRDRLALIFSLLQGLAVTLLTYLVRPSGFTWHTSGGSTMFVFGCASVWFGMINSVRELVKERTIWRREALAGANVAAYLSSKLVVLGVLSAIQAASMVLVIDLTFKLPTGGPVPESFIAIGLTLWLASLCGMAIGLLVSAFAPSSDRAMSLVPYLLITQFVLCGALFPLGSLTFISWIVPARWAVAALGGLANVMTLPGTPAASIYARSGLSLFGAWVALVVILAVGIGVTARVLQRQADRWSVG